MAAETDIELDNRRLREGLCPQPDHRVPLERRDDYGWCEECELGWSLTPDAVYMHVAVKTIHLDGRELRVKVREGEVLG